MVNGALTVWPLTPVSETDPENVPVPMPVRVAVPVAVNEPGLVKMEPVAVTVKLVLMVAACAAAQKQSARTKFVRVRIIFGKNSSLQGEVRLVVFVSRFIRYNKNARCRRIFASGAGLGTLYKRPLRRS
jgi:hypothetical protein